MLWCFEILMNTGQHVFWKGGIMACKGLLKLSEILAKDYKITSFATSPITSDRTEVLFSELKTNHGTYDYPNSNVITKRMDDFIILKMLDDPNFNLFSMESELMANLQNFKENFKKVHKNSAENENYSVISFNNGIASTPEIKTTELIKEFSPTGSLSTDPAKVNAFYMPL